MNRSERYRRRNRISTKKNSGYRTLPLLALVLFLAFLICNPLVNVKDFSFAVPFSPLDLHERIVNNRSLSGGKVSIYETNEAASKTIVINSSIEENIGTVSSEGNASEVSAESNTSTEEPTNSEPSLSSSSSRGTFGETDLKSYTSLSGSVINVKPVVRPSSGYVFESSGKGSLPQLTVVAPHDQDAYIKLKDPDTGKTVLSFYVQAGCTVKACIPVGYCDFFYVLGNGDDWLGTRNAFGENGVYAKADHPLNFTNPLSNYTYRFNVDDGNISPVTISEAAF